MKRITFLLLAQATALALAAQTSSYQFTSRTATNNLTRQGITFTRFTLSDAKTTDGRNLKGTDRVKTVSGKEMTVDEYLAQVNELEQVMTRKGMTLRNFKPAVTDLRYRPALINESKMQLDNSRINTGIRPVLTLQARETQLFAPTTQTTTTVQPQTSTGSTTLQSPTSTQLVRTSPITTAVNLKRTAEKIEKVYAIDSLLKPLTNLIQGSLSADGAKVNFSTAALTITTNAIPPADGNIAQSMGTTQSEYKVALNFGASITGSFGLPISLTIPMATMNGEFVARANNEAKHSRRVVVNLMGKSLFNKTSVINTATFSETDQQELTLNEIMGTPAMNTLNFMDYLPSIGFNTQFSNSGSVGCRYRVTMDRNNVTATIGPTYAVTLRLAAAYGFRDVLEGGIEGIVTLLRGGLEFGGTAGIARTNGAWRAVNTTFVESTLEALQGEVNFFVRYPDMTNWSCFGPCIKKETISIFKTPVAFRLTGRLLEQDNGKNLNW